MNTRQDAHMILSEGDGNGDLRREHSALSVLTICKEIRARHKPRTTAAKSGVKTSLSPLANAEDSAQSRSSPVPVGKEYRVLWLL